MYRMCVLALLAIGISSVHSFTWEIVEGTHKQLNFYENGTVKYSKYYDSARNIIAVVYDAVYNRVLFVDRNSSSIITISSFDIDTRKTESFDVDSGYVRKTEFLGIHSVYVRSLAYDPVTETLFLNEVTKITKVSLKSKQAVEENILTTRMMIYDIDVDSCGGYVYWNTLTTIERIRFDGSEREVIINNADTVMINNFIIDLQTQKIYWSERKGEKHQIESADLNGRNRRTILSGDHFQRSIIISKDFIYWKSGRTIWELPKNEWNSGLSVNVKPKIYINDSVGCQVCQDIAAKYTISEQIRGINNCEALKGIISKYSVPINSSALNDSTADVRLHCDHGEESRNQGHNASICQNYCIQGDCIVSSEGPPKCRCIAGYSGQRCEVNVCHNYCLQGNCSFGTEGQPECRCNAGYSGKRCEVSACHGYCLNGGLCSLNEDEPVCQCPAGYKGGRCDMFICIDYCLQGNCSVGTEGQPECRCNAGYSGKRCEVDACHGYCLNNGLCSLNEEDEPVCQCTEDYEGGRCDVLSDSRNETAGESCSHSQPELSSFDGEGSSMVTDRKKEGDCCEILNQINTLLQNRKA